MSDMTYVNLGDSNLKVSPICLGTMMFGDQTDAAHSGEIVASARDQGINFIDTADVYKAGASEEITGPLIKPERHWWVLATKLGNAMSANPNEVGYSRQWVMREVDNSLRRLQTDYIDILYLHLDREQDDLEEPLRALDDLIRAGKIHYWGISNFRGWRIAEAVRIADGLSMPRPTVCQPYYNLLNRMPEVEILPACANYGIGVVPYSPIARGVLAGKYKPGEKPAEGTRAARQDKRIMQTEWREESLVVAQKIGEYLEGKDVTMAQFAAAWVLANPIISSVIAGPRTLEQWQGYQGALDYPWTSADEDFIDSLVVPGHASTPGYHDPQYPFFGRPVD